MTRDLRILSGGAAQGLVRRMQPGFEQAHGVRLQGSFGAVGLMRDRLLAGEDCDLLILSDALVRELAAAGQVHAGSLRAVGVVKTGVALKAGAPARAIDSADALGALLRSAPGIYFPDPAKATAGIHFMKVLQGLGLADTLAARLRTFPNGATAMAALASGGEPDAVGCTQVTEILYTPGVRLAGLLPPPYELATTYTGAVCTRAAEPDAAAALLALLCGDAAADARREGGFEAAA